MSTETELEARLDAKLAAQQPNEGNLVTSEEEFRSPLEIKLDHKIALKEHGTAAETLLTGAEGAAQGALGPIATGIEEGLSRLGVPNLDAESRTARAEASPWIHGGAEAATLGAGFLTGSGQARVLGEIAEAGTKLVGFTAPRVTANKIGSKAVNAFIENSAFQSGSEITKFINQEPGQSAGSAISNIGLMGALGGGLSGGAGVASSLWKETIGKKTEGVLKAIADKYGGIEGVELTPMQEVASKSGIDLDPIIEGGLSEDRQISELFNTLNQSDTSKAGKEVQKVFKDFQHQAAETLTNSLGKTIEEIPEKIDTYEAGNKIGKKAAEAVKEIVDPRMKAYEDFQNKLGNEKLVQDEYIPAVKEIVQTPETIKNPYLTPQYNEVVTPEKLLKGITSEAADNLIKLAEKEAWKSSPSSETMSLVNRVIKELPLQKTVKELGGLIKSVNAEIDINAKNWTFNRNAGIIAKSLMESEGLALELAAGKEGAQKISLARSGYREAASKIRILMKELGLEGTSISGSSKKISELAQENGELFFKRISGKTNANLLKYLSEEFPTVAQELREAHINELLSRSVVNGELSPYKIVKGLSDLSPQLKEFVTAGNVEKINAVAKMLDQFKKMPHNFSNTARTASKLNKYGAETLLGMVSLLTGHGATSAVVTAGVTSLLKNEAPDAIRLAMLKWLGSSKPIESGAFKSMLDFLNHTIKGENQIKNATKSIFKTGEKVIPEHLLPKEEQLDHLDKKLKEIEVNPSKLMPSEKGTTYYMPSHGVAVTSALVNAANYVNSQRVRHPKAAPLDPPVKSSKEEEAAFRQVLRIAQKPLVVMDFLKDGTLTTTDMKHFTNLYPDLYKNISQKLMGDLIDYTAAGKTVPYRTRFGLSLFFGEPMDSSFIPQNIAANQAVYAQAEQERQQKQQGVGISKSAIGKSKAPSRLSLTRSDSGA